MTDFGLIILVFGLWLAYRFWLKPKMLKTRNTDKVHSRPEDISRKGKTLEADDIEYEEIDEE